MSLFAITGIPILLTGAALVGLPILLHLIMRQEPRRLPFPAFRFLKQRRQINQRKIRLRHLLLLLLRMALIALICLSLFQPTVLSDGFSLRGGRPIAAVLVIDTSPSMGYVLAADRTGLSEGRQRGLKLLDEPADGPWTCLDEARGRVMEILEDLPSMSRVAIVDTADRQPSWALNLDEARQRVRDLKKPKANSQPVTRALEGAYDLLAKGDAELEPGQEPFPRFLAVFSDRTATSWDVERTAELQSARDRVPPPGVNHVYVDVGVEKPMNAAITAVSMKPQIVPANQPVIVDVVVEATAAGAGENTLVFSVNGEDQRIAVTPTSDRPAIKQFRKDGLKPGLYQAKVSLVTPDGLPFDNEHFLTFRVREPRTLLVLVDYPSAHVLAGGLGLAATIDERASLWKLALESTRWYAVDVRPVQELDRPPQQGGLDLSKYALVTLMGLENPSKQVWTALDAYIQNKGKVIVVPGGPEMNVGAYNSDEAKKVLPKPYKAWHVVTAEKEGEWTWKALNSSRPMLRKFIEYQKEASSNLFEVRPPSVRGFWKVQDAPQDRVVVSYNDAPNQETRSPAVLALRTGDDRDSVLQFTVPLGPGSERPHPYAGSWFYLVLANEAVRSMTGDAEDATFNFTNGEFVPARWPAGAPPTTYYLSGPDVAASDAVLKREGETATVYLRAERTVSAGNFTVTAEDQSWKDGFSLNPPASESDLRRMEAKAVEEVFGPETVTPSDKQVPLVELLSGTFTQPIELFPFLMILLLVVLVVENLLANKFYRRKPGG